MGPCRPPDPPSFRKHRPLTPVLANQRAEPSRNLILSRWRSTKARKLKVRSSSFQGKRTWAFGLPLFKHPRLRSCSKQLLELSMRMHLAVFKNCQTQKLKLLRLLPLLSKSSLTMIKLFPSPTPSCTMIQLLYHLRLCSSSQNRWRVSNSSPENSTFCLFRSTLISGCQSRKGRIELSFKSSLNMILTGTSSSWPLIESCSLSLEMPAFGVLLSSTCSLTQIRESSRSTVPTRDGTTLK